MAAEVSTSLLRLVNGADKNDPPGTAASPAPITRDFLGGCLPIDCKELDMDLQAPSGWEKRLDLKSGKVFLQKCSSSNSSSSTSENRPPIGRDLPHFQDLNRPPHSKRGLNLFDDSTLDLKLVSSSSYNQSVCTLDKVKSALERAEKEALRKRSSSKSSSPRSNSSCSTRDLGSGSGSLAAGCPNCLLYVLISSSNPNCPRCNSTIPLPTASAAAKKPRIDLNMSI